MKGGLSVVKKFYQLLAGSIPKSSEGLYVEDFETTKSHHFDKLNENFTKDYELYLQTVMKQEEYLHLYRVGIKRDDPLWMENIARKVGLSLPKVIKHE